MTPFDKSRAIRAADKILKSASISVPAVPVEDLASLQNAIVKYAVLDDELSGMAYVQDGRAIIGVNALHHPNRQRFTIAHELGHLVLHRDYITANVHVDRTFVLRRDPVAATGTDAREIEANAFAAQLLMPSQWIKREALETEFDDEQAIASLARKYQVSVAALQNRLMNLF